MKFRLLVLTLRTVILLLAVGFIAVNGKGYIANEYGLVISPYAYFAATLIGICVTLWLSTRKLMSELRLRAAIERKEKGNISSFGDVVEYESIHKYPRQIGYLFLTLTVLGCSLPFIYPNTKHSASLTFLTICIIVSIGVATTVYFFRYTMYVCKGKLVVITFIRREYLLSDISNVIVVRGRDGLWALVSMKNGKIVRFRALLNNFDSLVMMLKKSCTD